MNMGGGMGPPLGFLRWEGEANIVEREGAGEGEEKEEERRELKEEPVWNTLANGFGGLGLRMGANGDSGFL